MMLSISLQLESKASQDFCCHASLELTPACLCCCRYDQNGVRTNTREIRYKEKLMDRRQVLIEEMIKADPTYRPPVGALGVLC